MISRNLSSDERSPPFASGWWRLTSSLYRALIFAGVASPLSSSVNSALIAKALYRGGGSVCGGVAFAPRRPRAGLGKNGFIYRLRARRRPRAHLPRWTVADRVGLTEFRHGGVVHAAKIVVRSVVFPHVVAAKAEILPFALAALWRAEHAFGRAARERTRRGRRLFRRALSRLDPDAVEQTRVQIHAMTFMTANAVGQARNARRQQKPANRVPIGIFSPQPSVTYVGSRSA